MTESFWQRVKSSEKTECSTGPGMCAHSLDQGLTDAPVSHYACTALSGNTALLKTPQRPLVFGMDYTAPVPSDGAFVWCGRSIWRTCSHQSRWWKSLLLLCCVEKKKSVLLAVGDGEHSDLCKIKIKSGPSESRFILAVSEYIHKAQNIFMYIYSHIFIWHQQTAVFSILCNRLNMWYLTVESITHMQIRYIWCIKQVSLTFSHMH